MSVKMTQPLSSGEFCKPCYDAIPVESASADISFYTSNSKTPNFELWHPLSQMSNMHYIDSFWIGSCNLVYTSTYLKYLKVCR